MTRSTLIFICTALILIACFAAAASGFEGNRKPIIYPHLLTPGGMGSPLDDFTDVLYWDDGVPFQWFGGLHNFALATRFKPIAEFELQGVRLFLVGTGQITIYVLDDDYNGISHNPGPPLMPPFQATFTPGPDGWDDITFPIPWLVLEANEWFWIKIESAGPPYEMYDVAPTLPADNYSKTWFNVGQIPDPSPGDNLIRAGGEYSGEWDLAVTSVTHNGFFHLNPAEVICNTLIENVGDVPLPLVGETALVKCQLWLEQGEGSTLLDEQEHLITSPIPPGGSEDHEFTWNISDDGRYFCRCVVEYDRDDNPLNNSMEKEFQVYTPTEWLGYVDYGTYLGASFTMPNGALAMRFDPGLGNSNYWIENLSIENLQIAPSGFATAAQIKILDDVGGNPVTVLWTATDENPPTGWHDYPVHVQTNGPFYVAYYFMGSTTSLLRFDDPPYSGQGWIKGTGAWTPDPNAYDWSMRAEIAVPPDFSLSIVPPQGSGLYIPPQGGYLTWHITVTNNLGIPYEADIWWYVNQGTVPILPATPIEEDYPFAPYEVYERDVTVYIPPSVGAGAFQMYTAVGHRPDLVYAGASFTFYKTISGGNEETNPTANNRLDGEGGTEFIPVEYSLSQNYPNPFNPVTAITFGLPESQYVKVAVYDLQGNRVTTLAAGVLNAGLHTLEFDASNLASGVYLYRLNAGEFSSIQKMVLMK